MTPTASAAGVMNFYGEILLGAEDAVACIAQAGDDVAVLVQLFILCGNINVNIGVCFVQGFQSFGGGNQANELDVLGTALFDLANGVNGAAAGSQHGIQHQNVTLGDILRQLAEVLHGLQGLFVAVQADEAHLGSGQQGQHTVQHTHAGTQDGHQSQLAACQHLGLCHGDGCFDLHLFQRQVTGRFVAQQGRDLANEVTELLGAGLFVAQPQTRAHIAEIFEIQAAEYARIKALSKSVLREVNQKTETPEETAPSYEVDFFRRELERMLKLFEHGVFAVKVIDNQYDAELFFQCENNRGKEMDLLDILKAYHMRIALSHNSKSMECIRQMWADVTDHGAASIYPLPEHKTVVLTLLLIRFGVEYWRHWDKMDVNRLKGVIGTYSGTSVGDKKLRKQSSTVIDEIQQSEFLPDLMSPIHPGIDFFKTFNYYLRIVKALEESRIFNGSECLFDNCVHLGLQAAVCWLDRFAEVHPNLDKPFAEDVADLSTAYKGNVELLIYIQAYWRIFRRLRKTVKVKIGNGNEETINCVFGRFSGPKQIAFFQLGNPNDNLLTLPYRTNSPAECRREFERLTSPGVIDSWRILWRKDKYARYVCYEAAAELMSQNGVNHD